MSRASTPRARMKSSVAGPGPGRVGRLVAVTVAGLSLAAGCSSPSYSDLSKIVHAVPTPAGLTYVGEARSSDAAFPNPNKDFSVDYSNTTMTCDQLSAAWIAALNKAHVHYDPVPVGSLGIYVKSSKAVVHIDMGLPYEGCHHPYVAAEPKQ